MRWAITSSTRRDRTAAAPEWRLQGAKQGDRPGSCKGATVGTPVPFEGAKFKWLAANGGHGHRQDAAGLWHQAFNGVQVAFIGLTLKATPTIVTPRCGGTRVSR